MPLSGLLPAPCRCWRGWLDNRGVSCIAGSSPGDWQGQCFGILMEDDGIFMDTWILVVHFFLGSFGEVHDMNSLSSRKVWERFSKITSISLLWKDPIFTVSKNGDASLVPKKMPGVGTCSRFELPLPGVGLWWLERWEDGPVGYEWSTFMFVKSWSSQIEFFLGYLPKFPKNETFWEIGWLARSWPCVFLVCASSWPTMTWL